MDEGKPTPLVSAIIPVYNVAPYLTECLESVFNQTISPLEVIIIEDCSTDDSRRILQQFLDCRKNDDITVKTVFHETNMGISFSRRQGLELASGEWVIYCDSDDWIDPDAYELALKAAIRENADMAVFGLSCFGEGVPSSVSIEGDGHVDSEAVFAGICGSSTQTVHGGLCTKLIRRRLWENVGFPDNISYCEDVYALLQILLKKPTVFFLPRALYHYRKTPGSLTHHNDRKRADELEHIIDIFGNLDHGLTETESNGISAKTTGFLYRLLATGRLTVSDFSKKYGERIDTVRYNRQLGFIKTKHLQTALRGNVAGERFWRAVTAFALRSRSLYYLFKKSLKR